MSAKNRSFLTDEDIEEAASAMKYLVSPDLRNKEAGLRHLIDLFLLPAHRALFDARPEWITSLKGELLHSESEIVSMLSMWALSHLALEAKRCESLASDNVLECARDILGSSFNSDLIEKTLWFLLNLGHNAVCVEKLTTDAKLCAYLTDLTASENPAVQISAIKVLHLLASGQHALVFRSVFCRKRGFRTICAILDSHDRCSNELLENVLNLTYSMITASGSDVTLKKLFIVGGLLPSLEGVSSIQDSVIKNKILLILVNLASSCSDMIAEFESNGIIEFARKTLLDTSDSPNTQGLAAVLMKVFMKNEEIAKKYALTGFCQSLLALLDTDKEKVIAAVLELLSTMAEIPVLKCELIASKIIPRLLRSEVELNALLPEDTFQPLQKAINDCRTVVCAPMEPEVVNEVLQFVTERAPSLAKKGNSKQTGYVQRVWTSALRARTSGEVVEEEKQTEEQKHGQERDEELKGDDRLLQKRDNIAQEILETEKRYVRSLQQCVDTYLVCLRTQPIISKANVEALFANLEEVVLHNKRFLRMLEDKMEGWNQQSCLGEVFSTFWVGYTKDVYSTYINNFDSALDLYYKLMDQNPQFNAFVMQSKKAIGLDLSSYLIMPVQRMPRYLLLLGTLLESTPQNHPDRESLQIAVTKARQLTDMINEDKRRTEERRKWMETVKQLDAVPATFGLNETTRRLIKKGLLIESSTSRSSHYIVLLLLSDSVVVTSQQKKKLKVLRVLPLESVTVDKAVPSFDGTVIHAFTVKDADHIYTFCANSPDERDEWINAFRTAMPQESAPETPITSPSTAAPASVTQPASAAAQSAANP